jgi:hypothetical protein
MARHIFAGLKDNFFNRNILAPVIGIWIIFAMPAFTFAVTEEFIEVYLEKYVRTRAHLKPEPAEPDFQTPPPLVGPWGRLRSTGACPTGTVIDGTATLCPIAPIEWN